MHGPEDALGRTVAGRYRLDKVLGEGGFGAVYVATRADGTQVALKVLAEDALERIGGDDRFRREAELARRLDHPNVVKVLDEGIDAEGTRFIAFELLRGRSLADELERWGAMQPRRAAHIALAVLDALEAAHAIGIIHRDLKPANVYLLDGSDQLKVLDFGIAKSINKNTIAGLTHSGQVLGTPAYMAVEQLTGDPVTPATDLFALGVVLTEMLIGRPPYPAGSTAMDIVRSRLTGLHLELPPDVAASPLGQVIRRACMPHPLERFQAASELRAALEEALRSPHLVNTAVSFGQEPRLGHGVTGAVGPTHLGAPPLTEQATSAPVVLQQPPPPPPVFHAPGPQPSSSGAVLVVAVVVGALAMAGLGVGLWLGAEPERPALSDHEDDEDDEDAEETRSASEKQAKGKRRGSKKAAPPDRRAPAPAEDPAPRDDPTPLSPPLPPPPEPPPPPPPAESAVRVRPCRGAATEDKASLTRHAQALGWTVKGELQYCAGSMINFRCMGGDGRGITMTAGATDGSAAAVRFSSAAAAEKHADEQRGGTDPVGTTWGVDGVVLLYIELPDAEADRLLARVCR